MDSAPSAEATPEGKQDALLATITPLNSPPAKREQENEGGGPNPKKGKVSRDKCVVEPTQPKALAPAPQPAGSPRTVKGDPVPAAFKLKSKLCQLKPEMEQLEKNI